MNQSAAAIAAVGICLVAGCTSAPLASGNGYRIQQIGGTVFIEPATSATTARAVGGALIGTAIAARLQSPPIPLKPGTDYACNYRDVVARLPITCPSNVPKQ